jgi:hypothetical protein
MEAWNPFSLSSDEYMKLKEWWFERYPGTKEDALGVDNWNDWVQEILDDDYDT